MDNNELKHLNVKLKNSLNSFSFYLKQDINNLLQDHGIIYIDGKSWDDVQAFMFEYEYEYLNIVFWAVDKNFEQITETNILPSILQRNSLDGGQWKALLPEEIFDAEAKLQNDYVTEEADEQFKEYLEEKYDIFEKWFFRIWHESIQEVAVNIPGYFSVHDTIWKYDLNHSKQIYETTTR